MKLKGILLAAYSSALAACANVSNLLIARCLGRQQEFAVRSALGAPRGRLIRGMLVEGALLSAMSCGRGTRTACAGLPTASKEPPPWSARCA